MKYKISKNDNFHNRLWGQMDYELWHSICRQLSLMLNWEVQERSNEHLRTRLFDRLYERLRDRLMIRLSNEI